jgi:uncharacterized protein
MRVASSKQVRGKRQVVKEKRQEADNRNKGQGANLLHNLVLFGRLLRVAGIDVNPGGMMELAQALAHIDIGRKADFYYAARSLLVHRQQDLSLFDRAFELFWQPPAELWQELQDSADALSQQPPAGRAPLPAGRDTARQSPTADDPSLNEIGQTFSQREILRQKEFANLTAEEVAAVKRLMAAITWNLYPRRSRRQQHGRGRAIDWRHTLRRNWRYGGEMLVLARRRRKLKPRPLVILADVSGSMEQYSRLLLHFIYSLAGGLAQPVEAFVFSTRLTRVTRQLQERNIDQALAKVGRTVPDWAGGTRIGEAIKQFNFDWGRRVLGHSAVVLIISDGWDRGDPELLGREMARLQRSSYRLIWLNPLLGSPEYRPLTRGMRAALPYVDDFRPVHNLASLEDLAEHLLSLERKKPL